jgi:hypothetical protein
MNKEYSFAEFICRSEITFNTEKASEEEYLSFLNHFNKFSFDGEVKYLIVDLGPTSPSNNRFANILLYDYAYDELMSFPKGKMPGHIGLVNLQLKHGNDPRIDSVINLKPKESSESNSSMKFGEPSSINKYAEEEEKKDSGGCFIATAVYGSYDAPEVIILRNFRDTILKKYLFGRLFINSYYTFSPSLAKFISKKHFLTRLLKVTFFRPFLHYLQKTN